MITAVHLNACGFFIDRGGSNGLILPVKNIGTTICRTDSSNT